MLEGSLMFMMAPAGPASTGSGDAAAGPICTGWHPPIEIMSKLK